MSFQRARPDGTRFPIIRQKGGNRAQKREAGGSLPWFNDLFIAKLKNPIS